MAFLGSPISPDVGLRLLLCPLGSNIVVRTACCSVGVVLPVYSTFKAIESKDQDDQHKWLVYWADSNRQEEGDKSMHGHTRTQSCNDDFSVGVFMLICHFFLNHWN